MRERPEGRGPIHPRFPFAFAISVAAGCVAGLLSQGDTVVGAANAPWIVVLTFLGGTLGGLLCGNNLRERTRLVWAFLILAGALVPITAGYVAWRRHFAIAELSLPIGIAFVPFAIAYAVLRDR